MRKKFILKILLATLTLFLNQYIFSATFAQTAWEVRTITLPVAGTVTFGDDFGDPRDGGARKHEGNDLMGAKMMPLVAAVDGTVRRVYYPEASFGYSIVLEDKDGYTYHYLHLNNDTPGTDDGKGGGQNAYAVDIDEGRKVIAGQLVGYMGDSGNAESTQAHLHFEIHRPDRTVINPYQSLKAARRIKTPITPYPKQPDELLPFGEFRGGSFVATGNADADADPELAIAAGPGGGPHVKIFKIDGTLIGGFMAYDPKFQGGVNVTAADIDNDGKAEIITSPGKGGGPHIKVFNEQGVMQSEFLAYDPGHRSGVRVSVGNAIEQSGLEIITVPLLGGSHTRVFSTAGQSLESEFAFEEWWPGSWDVTVSHGNIFVSTGPNTNRRTSIREVDTNNRPNRF